MGPYLAQHPKFRGGRRHEASAREIYVFKASGHKGGRDGGVPPGHNKTRHKTISKQSKSTRGEGGIAASRYETRNDPSARHQTGWVTGKAHGGPNRVGHGKAQEIIPKWSENLDFPDFS